VAIVSGVNQVLKIVVPQLTKLETHNTHVDFEKAVFGKLALAYVLNTALLPMAVGLLPMGITQAWYEEGGLVSIMMTQMVTAGVGFSFFQLLQPESLFRRKVLGRSAIGQPSLDRLFAPPKILFAEIHASTIKALAIGLIYAPLWPPAFGLTAVLLLFSFCCYRLALRFWYARPPPLDETLMDRMRYALLFLLMVHVLVVHVVSRAASASREYDNSRLAVMLSACLVGLLFITRGERIEVTNGVPYDRVDSVFVGTTIERYECPAAQVARRLRKLEYGVIGALKAEQSAARAEEIRKNKKALQPVRKGVKLTVCRNRPAQQASTTSAAGRARVAPDVAASR